MCFISEPKSAASPDRAAAARLIFLADGRAEPCGRFGNDARSSGGCGVFYACWGAGIVRGLLVHTLLYGRTRLTPECSQTRDTDSGITNGRHTEEMRRNTTTYVTFSRTLSLSAVPERSRFPVSEKHICSQGPGTAGRHPGAPWRRGRLRQQGSSPPS